MPADRPLEWDSWVAELKRLLALPPLRRSEKTTLGPQDPKFLLGDFLLTLPEVHVDELAEAVGEAPGQLRSYRDVAQKVPPAARVGSAWGVHRQLKDRPDLLRGGLTIRQAMALLGKDPVDSPADRRLSVEDRAEKARAFLADPEVYRLIDQEMAASRADRKARSAARLVHGELAARQRTVEAELRSARAAMAPFEATVKAELDLLRAAQLVHAVGETITDLEQADRLASALRALADEVTAALGKYAAIEDHQGVIVEGEVWQARPARAALADSVQRTLSTEGQTVTDHGW